MKKYQTEFKLEVVKSFLAGEGGAKLLARQWSVPEKKIRTWVNHYRLHALTRAKKRSRHVQGTRDVHVPNVLQRNFLAKAPTRSG